MMMMVMMMMMMKMTQMKLVNSGTKFRPRIDKFSQPNSGGPQFQKRARGYIYTTLYVYIYILSHTTMLWIVIEDINHTIYWGCNPQSWGYNNKNDMGYITNNVGVIHQDFLLQRLKTKTQPLTYPNIRIPR